MKNFMICDKCKKTKEIDLINGVVYCKECDNYDR